MKVEGEDLTANAITLEGVPYCWCLDARRGRPCRVAVVLEGGDRAACVVTLEWESSGRAVTLEVSCYCGFLT